MMRTMTLVVFCLAFYLPLPAQTRYQQPLDENLRRAGIEYALKNELPLCFIQATLEYNTAGILLLKLFSQNVTRKIIDTYTIEVYCFGQNNLPVAHETKKTYAYTGIYMDFKPSLTNVYFPDIWALDGYKKTTRVKVYLIKVNFWDGTSWTPKDKNVTLIEATLIRSYVTKDTP